jgi:hypothetical protein
MIFSQGRFCLVVGLLLLAGFNALAVHFYRQVPAQASSGTVLPPPEGRGEGDPSPFPLPLPPSDYEWAIRIKMGDPIAAVTPVPPPTPATNPIPTPTPTPVKPPNVGEVTKPLPGDVLVLVLETNASHFADEKFGKQLAKIKEMHGDRLLNRTIYRISPQTIEPWKPEPSAKVFENAHYDAMFVQVFKQVEKLAEQAANRSFRTILLWESDEDPRFGGQVVTPPKGRTYYLCYWFTNRMEDSSSLADWFGPSNAKRPPKMDDLAAYVDYFIKRR